jgi:hypothetical protein
MDDKLNERFSDVHAEPWRYRFNSHLKEARMHTPYETRAPFLERAFSSIAAFLVLFTMPVPQRQLVSRLKIRQKPANRPRRKE